jgi:hypothetical protein
MDNGLYKYNISNFASPGSYRRSQQHFKINILCLPFLQAADTLNEIDGVDPPTPGRHAPKNKKQCEAKKAEKKRICGPRTLFLLSQACRATARTIAATGLFLLVYDNINMMV